MAPAEIWQGGNIVNTIQGDNTHEGKLHGKVVFVRNASPGCELNNMEGYIEVGDSVTLDGGEIVKSVNDNSVNK